MYKAVNGFMKDMNRKMGVRVVILTSFINAEDQAVCSKQVPFLQAPVLFLTNLTSDLRRQSQVGSLPKSIVIGRQATFGTRGVNILLPLPMVRITITVINFYISNFDNVRWWK
jgi:hypothetical protein